MFDHLHVQAYGKSTPLSEVGQVTIKSPTLAVINVYDPEVGGCLRVTNKSIGR
jgi:ribosome recycling factor